MAKLACKRKGGHLATPRNAGQDNCIKRLDGIEQYSAEGSWIGLYSKRAFDAPFRYITNNELVKMEDLTNWTMNHLDLSKRCMAAGTIRDNTGWHVARCGRRFNPVCERPTIRSKCQI